ncbi:MAG: fused ferrous iron transport protein A/B [Cytophagales bacterium]|nr:fused ferrous iron transport protein A/B [Cytophagales bacterium]
MRLRDLLSAECGIISGFSPVTPRERYLNELGFFNGQEVYILFNPAGDDHLICKIRGYEIALSYADASMIPVVKKSDHYVSNDLCVDCSSCGRCDFTKNVSSQALVNTINIALVGNPNCGKTTLFNFVGHTHDHVGNYAGVTVDFAKTTVVFNNYQFNIVDLPGVYSFNSSNPDERCTAEYLNKEHVDIILNVLDSTRLERGLYITTQLLQQNKKIICAFNFFDKVINNGYNISLEKFKNITGVEAVSIITETGFGINRLFQKIIELYTNDNYNIVQGTYNSVEESYQNVDNILKHIEYTDMVDKSYLTTYTLDKIFLNKYFGIGSFIIFSMTMFFTAFYIGQLPTYMFDFLISKISFIITICAPVEWMRSLLIDGILTGVGSTIIFVPQIFILYLFINFFEESGYASRVVLLIDRCMRNIGLHGRSFLPLISGLGCNVPAILLTKGISNTKNRLITTIAIPMISCPAKLPVYIMLTGLFFSSSFQSIIICGIYVLGVIIAIIVSKILNHVMKEHNGDYVIEIQEYKLPKMSYMIKDSFQRCKHFLKNIGTVIVITSTIFWGLSYFPHDPNIEKKQQIVQSYIGQIGKEIEPWFRPLGFSWKLGVSLLSGVCAKETIVPTITSLYKDTTNDNIKENMIQDGLSRTSIIAFLIFVLLYFPCFGTLATIRKLCGIKWMLFSLLLNTCLAYLCAFICHQTVSCISLHLPRWIDYISL